MNPTPLLAPLAAPAASPVGPALLLLFPIVPLLMAALLVLVRVPALQRAVMIATPAASAVAGAWLLAFHTHTPVVAHQVGGFVPGIAIPFVSDTLSALMVTVTSLTATVCAAFLALTGEDRLRFAPTLVLMLLGGVNGALFTGDLFNLFVWVEVMLLPSYALLAFTGTWRRLGLGRVFVLVNLLTSTLLLVSVGFVYGVTGTVTLAGLAGAGARDPRAGLALTLVLFALAVKSGLAPVHGWLPRSYPATSAGVMALFSALHTKVGLYGLYRVYSVVFGTQPPPWLPVFAVVVVVTILLGAFATAGESRIRPVLAWQMVSGVGQIAVGLALFTAASLSAGLFYLIHHIVTMGALLLLAGAIEHTYGSGAFDRLSGLARRDPWVAAGFALGLFSLVGLPPTSGLWGKIGLVTAGTASADAHPLLAWSLVGAVVLASVISLLALQRLWNEVFWGRPQETYRPIVDHRATPPRPVTDAVRVPWALAAPGLLLVGVSVVMFLTAGVLVPITDRAATGLVDLAPYVQAVLP